MGAGHHLLDLRVLGLTLPAATRRVLPFAGILRFASWILLSLEFALAADIVRTAIAPTWDDIGQLAAIAAIRTFLNYFLERDLEAFMHERKPEPGA